MFSSGSLSSISLATVTPYLVIVGEPNFLSSTTLRPLGPNVTFTASASLLTPRKIAWRLSSPWTICFAFAIFTPSEDLLRPVVCTSGGGFDFEYHSTPAVPGLPSPRWFPADGGFRDRTGARWRDLNYFSPPEAAWLAASMTPNTSSSRKIR